MSNPVWPISLPQLVNVGGFKESYAQGAIVTAMDAGPPKMRRRFTAVPKNFDVSLTMDSDQVDTLQAFWKDTCAMGAIKFDWVEFRAPATPKTYSFIPGKEPQISAQDSEIFSVSFSLLQWP